MVNNVCSTLEKRIYEENAQLDEKFTAACDAIEKKELVKNNEQDDTIDKQEQHFAVLCESLEQKLKEKTSLLDEKFTDVASLLDKKFTEENGATPPLPCESTVSMVANTVPFLAVLRQEQREDREPQPPLHRDVPRAQQGLDREDC